MTLIIYLEISWAMSSCYQTLKAADSGFFLIPEANIKGCYFKKHQNFKYKRRFQALEGVIKTAIIIKKKEHVSFNNLLAKLSLGFSNKFLCLYQRLLSYNSRTFHISSPFYSSTKLVLVL
jgi:hypothetical protein